MKFATHTCVNFYMPIHIQREQLLLSINLSVYACVHVRSNWDTDWTTHEGETGMNLKVNNDSNYWLDSPEWDSGLKWMECLDLRWGPILNRWIPPLSISSGFGLPMALGGIGHRDGWWHESFPPVGGDDDLVELRKYYQSIHWHRSLHSNFQLLHQLHRGRSRHTLGWSTSDNCSADSYSSWWMRGSRRLLRHPRFRRRRFRSIDW